MSDSPRDELPEELRRALRERMLQQAPSRSASHQARCEHQFMPALTAESDSEHCLNPSLWECIHCSLLLNGRDAFTVEDVLERRNKPALLEGALADEWDDEVWLSEDHVHLIDCVERAKLYLQNGEREERVLKHFILRLNGLQTDEYDPREQTELLLQGIGASDSLRSFCEEWLDSLGM